MKKQLSILVPVYNVEKYIRAFFESIFRQELPDDCYEIIVVNDGTPDRSMERVADLLAQHDNIKVINQENQGLSVARNVALAQATGEYVIMLDSDDLLIERRLPLMLQKALESKADLVVADYLRMDDDEIATLSTLPLPQDIHWEEKSGKKMFVENLDPDSCYVWLALYRRAFLQEHGLQFVPGIYFQDVPFTHECYLKAGKCLKTDMPLVIYRKREGSVQSHFTLRHAKDFSIAIGKTWALRNMEGIGQEEYRKLQSDMFMSFYLMSRLTLRGIHGFRDRLRAMDYLAQYAPDLRFSEGRQQKAISFLYHLSPRLLMTLWILRWNKNQDK